jgi:hypothetical protein
MYLQQRKLSRAMTVRCCTRTAYGERLRCCRIIRNPTITKDTKDYMYLQQRALSRAMTVRCCTRTAYGERLRCCRIIRNPTITKDTKDYMYLKQHALSGAMTVCCCTHTISPTITKDTPKTSCTVYVAVELYLIQQYAKTRT